MSCSFHERELVTFWLAGTLDPDEAERVSRHVDGCDDCRTGLVDGRTVVDGLRELHLRSDEAVAAAAGDVNPPHLLVCSRCRGEVALLRSINADLTRDNAARRWMHAWLVPTAVAAVLLLGVGLARYAARDRGAGVPAHASMRPEATIVQRTDPVEPLPVRVAESRALVYRRPGVSSQPFLEAFNRAIAPYRAGRYPDAANRLAELAADFPDAPEPPLYEGVAQLLSGRPDAAIGPLERATLLAQDSEWQPDAEYYDARARLASGRGEGRQTLVRLCANSGPYQSQSCRALGAAAPLPVR